MELSDMFLSGATTEDSESIFCTDYPASKVEQLCPTWQEKHNTELHSNLTTQFSSFSLPFQGNESELKVEGGSNFGSSVKASDSVEVNCGQVDHNDYNGLFVSQRQTTLKNVSCNSQRETLTFTDQGSLITSNIGCYAQCDGSFFSKVDDIIDDLSIENGIRKNFILSQIDSGPFVDHGHLPLLSGPISDSTFTSSLVTGLCDVTGSDANSFAQPSHQNVFTPIDQMERRMAEMSTTSDVPTIGSQTEVKRMFEKDNMYEDKPIMEGQTQSYEYPLVMTSSTKGASCSSSMTCTTRDADISQATMDALTSMDKCTDSTCLFSMYPSQGYSWSLLASQGTKPCDVYTNGYTPSVSQFSHLSSPTYIVENMSMPSLSASFFGSSNLFQSGVANENTSSHIETGQAACSLLQRRAQSLTKVDCHQGEKGISQSGNELATLSQTSCLSGSLNTSTMGFATRIEVDPSSKHGLTSILLGSSSSLSSSPETNLQNSLDSTFTNCANAGTEEVSRLTPKAKSRGRPPVPLLSMKCSKGTNLRGRKTGAVRRKLQAFAETINKLTAEVLSITPETVNARHVEQALATLLTLNICGIDARSVVEQIQEGKLAESLRTEALKQAAQHERWDNFDEKCCYTLGSDVAIYKGVTTNNSVFFDQPNDGHASRGSFLLSKVEEDSIKG